MKAMQHNFAFVMTPLQQREVAHWHKSLPRTMRKALQLKVVKPKQTKVSSDVVSYMEYGYRNDPCHNTNLVDPDMDIYSYAEFGDIDDDLSGLQITEPAGEVELFEFCTGYNVI